LKVRNGGGLYDFRNSAALRVHHLGRPVTWPHYEMFVHRGCCVQFGGYKTCSFTSPKINVEINSGSRWLGCPLPSFVTAWPYRWVAFLQIGRGCNSVFLNSLMIILIGEETVCVCTCVRACVWERWGWGYLFTNIWSWILWSYDYYCYFLLV